MGAASGNDLTATLGRHARAESMAALANELARLIRPLHGSSPVEKGSGAHGSRPSEWLGFSPKLSQKTSSARRERCHLAGLMKEGSAKVNAARCSAALEKGLFLKAKLTFGPALFDAK